MRALATGGGIDLSYEQLLAVAHMEGLCPGTLPDPGAFTCPARCGGQAAFFEPTQDVVGWWCQNAACGAKGSAVALFEHTRKLPTDEAVRQVVEAKAMGLHYLNLEAAAHARWVFVTVGLLDTSQLMEAVMEHEGRGYAVLGFPTTGDLQTLPLLLPPKGRRFVLCGGNDPVSRARLACESMRKTLLKGGAARVEVFLPPPQFPTFTAWRAEGAIPLRAPKPAPMRQPGDDEDTGRLVPVDGEGDGGGGDGGDDGGGRPDPPPKLTNSYASLVSILTRPDTAKVALEDRALEYNEMLGCVTLDRAAVTDMDYSRIRVAVERNLFTWNKGEALEFGKAEVADAVDAVGRTNPFHPVREYLGGLTWDQQPRLHRVATDVLHAEEDPIIRLFVRQWFIAAVARIFEPGCKVDFALILVGPQGTGKSSFFKILASEPWFSETSHDPGEREALMNIAEVWIWEWAELAAMQKARDLETVKGFLTNTVDRFRRPYARAMETHPRTCLTVGTTNNEQPLLELGRRWPLVYVPSKIDREALRAMRDQLWAEAVGAYRSKERWHLTDAEEVQLMEYQKRFLRTDPWEDNIRDWCFNHVTSTWRQEITTGQVLHTALEKPIGQWSRADEMRVGAMLVDLGYRRVRIRRGSTRSFVYRKDQQVDIEDEGFKL